MKTQIQNLSFISYPFASPLYASSIEIRDELLKKPLGITFDEEELSEEWKSFHLGIVASSMKLIGCLVLTPLPDQEIKMRQVGVLQDFQGLGIGKTLVLHSEKFASRKGFRKIQLNARKAIVPFYEMLDYQTVGNEFTEVGIPHLHMTKELI